jgi:hypothetical protein
MLGGGIIFILYAIVGLWLVSSTALYVFWLAVIAHAQIFTIMTGYIAQLVKRRVSIGKEGASITDNPSEENH